MIIFFNTKPTVPDNLTELLGEKDDPVQRPIRSKNLFYHNKNH